MRQNRGKRKVIKISLQKRETFKFDSKLKRLLEICFLIRSTFQQRLYRLIYLVIAVQCDAEELFKSNCDRTRLLRVLLPESVGESLNFHAENDELIHGYLTTVHRIVLRDEELDELLREAESHLRDILGKDQIKSHAS